ncbi:unnamed protein product [Brachionus calyciflorus]|uniref:Uncharacterized protein n=1 Tax=Brachionus calyciflorus TaxID=104777 RepID=A0A813M2D9_9BILA|nr:unnamed protein product [Brachionus calyciflorus]
MTSHSLNVNKHLNENNHKHDHEIKLHNQPSSSIAIHDRNNPEEVKNFAFAVCREYLSGAWKKIDYNDFKVERISGGLSNYLYRCELNKDKFKQVNNEPNAILLRLYGENHHKHSSILLKDIIVSAIMSDHNLGPKLYGVFPNGRLEEFINTTTMAQDDMYVPELSRSIAKVMARFHTLEMPFIKEPQWLFDSTYKYIKQANEVSFSNEKDIKRFTKLLSFNLEHEFKKLKKILKALNSPVVFCHNDINVGNILKLPEKLMVIDYEYGSYNYRGFDLGNHFCEWMFNNNYENHPYFQYHYEYYPNREQQINFITSYIEEYKKAKVSKNGTNNAEDIEIDENDKENKKDSNKLDIEQLISEANHFALMSHIFWIFWSICQASVCKIQFEYLEYALARCDAYFKQKKILFPNGYEANEN